MTDQPGFYVEAVVSGVNDCNSISSGPDNGANNNLACAFSKAKRHSTTEGAVNNFLACLPQLSAQSADREEDADVQTRRVVGNCNLAGHGNEGLLTTGAGQTGQQTEHNYMSNWNEWAWGPQMARLAQKSFPVLSIWSCHTGAGEDGADFLYAVAKRVGRAVRARTGFLYSNVKCEVWFENGSVWQVATPSHRPTAIQAPSEHFLARNIMADKLDSVVPGLELSAVRRVEILRTSPLANTLGVEALEPETGDLLLKEIAGASAFELPGAPAAVVTAVIGVSYAENSTSRVSGTDKRVEFAVFNDRLVVAPNGTSAWYAGPVLRSLLRNFR